MRDSTPAGSRSRRSASTHPRSAPTTTSRRRSHLSGVTEPYIFTVGTVEPRKDYPTIVAAGREAALVASRPDACHRRPARVGRCAGNSSALRSRARRDAMASHRRAVPPRCGVRHRVPLRGVRPARDRGNGSRRADDHDHGLRPRRGRRGRRLAVRARRRRRLRRRRSARYSKTTRSAQSLSRRGRDRASELTWERSARAHADAYARALAHRS